MEQWLDNLDEQKPRVSEDVLEKILQVNPSLRRGRSTDQVKADLEAGRPVQLTPTEPAPQSEAQSSDIAKTVDFFLKAKTHRIRDGPTRNRGAPKSPRRRTPQKRCHRARGNRSVLELGGAGFIGSEQSARQAQRLFVASAHSGQPESSMTTAAPDKVLIGDTELVPVRARAVTVSNQDTFDNEQVVEVKVGMAPRALQADVDSRLDLNPFPVFAETDASVGNADEGYKLVALSPEEISRVVGLMTNPSAAESRMVQAVHALVRDDAALFQHLDPQTAQAAHQFSSAPSLREVKESIYEWIGENDSVDPMMLMLQVLRDSYQTQVGVLDDMRKTLERVNANRELLRGEAGRTRQAMSNHAGMEKEDLLPSGFETYTVNANGDFTERLVTAREAEMDQQRIDDELAAAARIEAEGLTPARLTKIMWYTLNPLEALKEENLGEIVTLAGLLDAEQGEKFGGPLLRAIAGNVWFNKNGEAAAAVFTEIVKALSPEAAVGVLHDFPEAYNFLNGTDYDYAVNHGFKDKVSEATGTELDENKDDVLREVRNAVRTYKSEKASNEYKKSQQPQHDTSTPDGAAAAGERYQWKVNDHLHARTFGELEDHLEHVEEKMNAMGEDAQLMQTDLQGGLQKLQQNLQTISNIMKALHDTNQDTIRKIGA